MYASDFVNKADKKQQQQQKNMISNEILVIAQILDSEKVEPPRNSQ